MITENEISRPTKWRRLTHEHYRSDKWDIMQICSPQFHEQCHAWRIYLNGKLIGRLCRTVKSAKKEIDKLCR